ncbi:MAG TPA: class I adenylate-forming enzyme family protein, partial [Solirubrobacteraceae bacterium]|nr:class I adenylate-forming enzyme family protein [Solirubrobacteraceae bacterium]
MSDRPGYRYDASSFRRVFERHFTYLAGVHRNSHRFANRPALHDPASGRRWTYATLWEDAGRLAGALHGAGVQRGDTVVFSLFNGPEFVFVWLAAQRLGAVAAPINFRLSPGEVAYVLDDSRPRAFVFDAALAETAAAALERARHRPALLASASDAPGAAATVAELIASGDPHGLPELPSDVSTYDETTRLYTSGTTGMPKGVSLSGIVDVLSAHDVIMHFPLSPQDRTLNMT